MTPEPLRVVVADDAAVGRHLVRYFLEGEGFSVVGEASRGQDALRLVAAHKPDAVVLHERIQGTNGGSAVAGIREASPQTKVVVFSPTPQAPAAAAGEPQADAYLEEGVGVKDLASVLRRLCEAGKPAAVAAAIGAPAGTEVAAAPAGPRWGERWARLLGATAAAFVLLLGFTLFATGPVGQRLGITPTTPPDGGTQVEPPTDPHIIAAVVALNELVTALDSGASPGEIARLAREVALERAAAVAEGADTAWLDDLIASRLSPYLDGLSRQTLLALRAIFGPGVVSGTPSSGPGPGPEPDSGPGPGPSPSPSPSPEPGPGPGPGPGPSPGPGGGGGEEPHCNKRGDGDGDGNCFGHDKHDGHENDGGPCNRQGEGNGDGNCFGHDEEHGNGERGRSSGRGKPGRSSFSPLLALPAGTARALRRARRR